MSFTICGAPLHCDPHVAQLWSSLNKTSVVTLVGGALFTCPVPKASDCHTSPRPPHPVTPPIALAAQYDRDTPPCRAIPFRDSIAEGGIAHICLVFIGYRAGIAEIPLLRGVIAPPPRMLSHGETLRKGGRGYRTQLAMLRHQKPHSAQ